MVTEVKTLNDIVPSFGKSKPAPISSRILTALSKEGTEGILMDPKLRDLSVWTVKSLGSFHLKDQRRPSISSSAQTWEHLGKVRMNFLLSVSIDVQCQRHS